MITGPALQQDEVGKERGCQVAAALHGTEEGVDLYFRNAWSLNFLKEDEFASPWPTDEAAITSRQDTRVSSLLRSNDRQRDRVRYEHPVLGLTCQEPSMTSRSACPLLDTLSNRRTGPLSKSRYMLRGDATAEPGHHHDLGNSAKRRCERAIHQPLPQNQVPVPERPCSSTSDAHCNISHEL